MKKIVLVEDEVVLSKAIHIELEDAGFHVKSALDGAAGLELIRKEQPDLVLLDIILPKMNGFDVLAALKKDPNTKKIPVVILSNLGHEDDRKRGMELGAVDYCLKSTTDLSELSKKIEKFL
jgi:DNA-binding response OmpR family regulator